MKTGKTKSRPLYGSDTELDFPNVALITIYLLNIALLAFILSCYSYEIQAIVITTLIVFAFIIDRLLLHFFREYFVKQWYYLCLYSFKRGNAESIITPFIFIGMIVYWITQKLVFKYRYRK